MSMQLIYHVSGRLVIIQAPTISNHNTISMAHQTEYMVDGANAQNFRSRK